MRQTGDTHTCGRGAAGRSRPTARPWRSTARRRSSRSSSQSADACDEGGLAGDDTNNNRAFLSGGICAANNGASIYIEAKRKPDTYLTEKGEPMQEAMDGLRPAEATLWL
jgi:hypothetical protein